MKSILKYILTLVVAFSFIACSMDEMDTSIPNSGTTIEFIARPTSFISCNVETRAIEKEDFEDDIVNAYFLLYDANGTLIDDAQEVSETGLRYRYTFDSDNKDLTGYKVCFIANVPEARIPDVGSEWAQLEATVLDITYIDKSGYDFPVPSLNGTPCLPMFGYTELSSDPTQTVAVELKSLFAKVNLNIELDFSESLSDWTALLKGDASFKLTSISLINLPKKVSIIEPQESSWVNDRESFSGDIEVTTEIEVTEKSTFTCYVPEYILNSTGKNNDQTKKSSFVSGDKYPVHFTVEGVFHHPNMIADVPFTYTIHLGENVYDDFNIKRNKLYNFNMAVTGINQARLDMDDRVEVDMPYENLSANGSANCYIIQKVGRYRINATKGNSEVSIGNIPVDDKGNVLYYDTSITDNSSNVLSNIKFEDGYIWFDVNMSNLASVTNGNTMLIIKNGNDILWSWHLWFDGGFYNTTLGSAYDEQEYPGGSTMMSRPIGATGSLTTDGLYYQWGDKDPYLKGAYCGGVEADTWAHKEGKKTITDPCPPGYKVPSHDVWRGSNPDEKYSTQLRYQYHVSTELIDAILYPYSYALNDNGETINESSDTFIPHTVPGPCEAVNLSNPRRGRVKITDIELEIIPTHFTGALWSCDWNDMKSVPLSLYYRFSTLDLSSFSVTTIKSHVTIKKCMVSEGSGIFTVTWGKPYEVKGSNLTDYERTAIFTLILTGSVSDYDYNNMNTSFDSTNGLQVRCVVDE